MEGEPGAKIWSINKSEDRLVIKCNRAVVLDLSPDGCDLKMTADTTKIWKKEIIKVQFGLKPDTASFKWRNYDASRDQGKAQRVFVLRFYVKC